MWCWCWLNLTLEQFFHGTCWWCDDVNNCQQKPEVSYCHFNYSIYFTLKVFIISLLDLDSFVSPHKLRASISVTFLNFICLLIVLLCTKPVRNSSNYFFNVWYRTWSYNTMCTKVIEVGIVYSSLTLMYWDPPRPLVIFID